MWFAALGQYNSNPWFVNLIAKLLTNNVDVVDLLENNPFPSTPPRMIRAQLWDYHFTQPTNGSLWGDIKASFSEKMNSASATSSTSASTSVSKRWWTRQPKSDYLPMLRYTSNSTSPPPFFSLTHFPILVQQFAQPIIGCLLSQLWMGCATNPSDTQE